MNRDPFRKQAFSRFLGGWMKPERFGAYRENFGQLRTSTGELLRSLEFQRGLQLRQNRIGYDFVGG
jgi:hypothetical protein